LMSFTHLLLRLALGRRLPVTAGEIRIRGPVAPITIRRDKFGIPHIDATSDADAMFAMGFCQGQDRGGQLEFLWRTARGRLAEWVGSPGLGADRLSRRIGFRRAAEKQLPVLGDWARDQLIAFAAGVSEGNTTGLTNKPHEFAILGGEPSPWDAIDVLAVLKLQSFILPSNWDVELARLRILLADGPAALLALDPLRVSAGELNSSPLPPHSLSPVLAALSSDLAALQAYLPRGGGSNNWVIAGSRTQSGRPILASDPHLAPSAPPPWYLAHIRTPDWEATGAALAGSPSFAIGHNGFAAWGVTAGLTDNSDLFLETLGADGKSVREADGTFTPCEVVREAIAVKDQPGVIEEVMVTPRGPVLSPLMKDIPHLVSLRAVWLDPLPLNGFLSSPRARSFDAFRGTFDQWPILPLNVLYADTTGTTGWFLIGQLPKRAGGHGLMPRPADRSDSGWTGLIPFAEMPFVQNPEQTFWATANNDPNRPLCEDHSFSDPVHTENGKIREPMPSTHQRLGADYCDPYRVRTIIEAIASHSGWTVEDCLALQRDVRSIPWEEIREIVLSIKTSNPDACEGLELLRAWDGRVDSESPAACVFELFVAELCVRVAKAKAPRAWQVALGEVGLWDGNLSLFTDRRIQHLVRLLREQPVGWFSSWSDEMIDVLTGVVQRLRRSVGPGPAYWAWGHLRQLRLEHPLFGKHPWLSGAFNIGPVPCGGDCNTISQAGARAANPTDFTHNMCNLRTVFDLSDLSKSKFVLCGGQSGNPWSNHHADHFPLWQAGEAITIAWNQAAVIREAEDTLRLLPG
jgi:penicillin G amidase